MKVSNIKNFLLDIKNRMVLSLKLMYSNRITVTVIAITLILTYFLLQILNSESKEKSSVPVGVVNMDILNENTKETSKLSQDLVQALKKIESISVTSDTFDRLFEKLLAGEVYTIFVINENYEKNIRSGNFKELISVYQGSFSKVINLLKDIVAGEMMFEICLTKASNMYLNLKDTNVSKMTFEQFAAYAKEISSSSEFNFSFKTSYVNTEEGIVLENLNNQLIYRQIIGAIFAMFLSFTILFAFTYLPIEKSQGMAVRSRITEMNPLAVMIANLCAVFILVSMLCLCFSGLLSFYLKDFNKFFPLLLTSYWYVFFMSILFYALGKITKSIFTYQFAGAFIVIVFGALGLYSIVDNITMMTADFYNFAPNSWFIRKIADIILY